MLKFIKDIIAVKNPQIMISPIRKDSNRLDIKPEGFYEYIYDATSNINRDCDDKLLRTTVLGSNYNNQKPGMMAYNIAKYYEKFRIGEYKKPLIYGLVK